MRIALNPNTTETRLDGRPRRFYLVTTDTGRVVVTSEDGTRIHPDAFSRDPYNAYPADAKAALPDAILEIENSGGRKTITFDEAQETFRFDPTRISARLYQQQALIYWHDEMIGDETFLEAMKEIAVVVGSSLD